MSVPWDERAEELAETEGPFADFTAFCEFMAGREEDLGWWDELGALDQSLVYSLVREMVDR